MGILKQNVIWIVSIGVNFIFEKSGMGVKLKWYGVNISGKVVSGIGIIFFSDNVVGVVKLKGYKVQTFQG